MILIYFIHTGKGRCYVYFARYTYDPISQSLNDNPESELYLTAGDYILVWGDCDEDGYLEGGMYLYIYFQKKNHTFISQRDRSKYFFYKSFVKVCVGARGPDWGFPEPK